MLKSHATTLLTNTDWWFIVKGKGDKLGKIPVNNELLKIIKDYRELILLKYDLPKPNEEYPIAISWRTGEALTARYINILLKKLAMKTAEQFIDDVAKQEKFKKFSAHWLRHLSATMQERAGINEKYIKENMRHENLTTTRLYLHTDEKKRHKDMELLELTIYSTLG